MKVQASGNSLEAPDNICTFGDCIVITDSDAHSVLQAFNVIHHELIARHTINRKGFHLSDLKSSVAIFSGLGLAFGTSNEANDRHNLPWFHSH
ncbi:MAG: hypothetical protein ACO3A4_04230 [Silvanigrellaceae bacterium]